MRYAQIIDGVVVQTQPNEENGFIEYDEAEIQVVPGMLYDGNDFSDPPVDLDALEFVKRSQAKAEMYRVLSLGFQWRETNSDDWFAVGIDAEMQGFLTRTLLKMNEGRADPHGGFIRSNGVSVDIDDVGMREMCLFAGVWGDSISAIRIAALDSVTDWGDFDPFTDINWSVNWTGEDAANGWNDNTLTQVP